MSLVRDAVRGTRYRPLPGEHVVAARAVKDAARSAAGALMATHTAEDISTGHVDLAAVAAAASGTFAPRTTLTPDDIAAALIEQGGFKASTQGLLGPGVYVSRDVRKSRMYGSTILEVMVRVGRVCRADRHPELIPRGYGTDAPWHDVGGYDTAWVPPDCPASVFQGAHFHQGIVEEDCVWEACRVSVMGRAERGRLCEEPEPVDRGHGEGAGGREGR